MFGCLRRLGCLIILLLAAGGGYYWWRTHHAHSATTTVAQGSWHRVTAADREQGRKQVSTLQSTAGKVYVNLTPAQAVGYLLSGVSQELPPSAQAVDAMISGDTLNVRAVVPLRDLGAGKALGPLAAFLGAQDTVQLGGTVAVIRNGLAQFTITRVTVHDLDVPKPAIPKLLQQLRRETPEGVAPNAFAVPLPPYISDVRIANGKVTLYKNV